MEKWKEFCKGVYFGLLAIGLFIFLLNDFYWLMKEPSYQVGFQLYLSIAVGFLIIPFFIKVGFGLEKKFQNNQIMSGKVDMNINNKKKTLVTVTSFTR